MSNKLKLRTLSVCAALLVSSTSLFLFAQDAGENRPRARGKPKEISIENLLRVLEKYQALSWDETVG